MNNAINLLNLLGIVYYTSRHVHIINNFIDTKNDNVEDLLNQLGSWTKKDLEITENWYKNLK